MEQVFNSDYLVASDQYSEIMNSVVLPFLSSREKACRINGYDNKPLYCVSYHADNPLGTVLILHGFTENAYKFAELIYSLLNMHYAVIAYDQRGHGRSWRDDQVSDASVTHVDHFEDYVKDLKCVCDSVLPDFPKPWTVFSHSMGGAVAAWYLEENPETFDAAVMSAPMIAPNTGGIPKFIVRLICNTAKIFGHGKNHPFFMKAYSGPEDFNTSCATDPIRFAWFDHVKASTKEFQNSIPSYQWSLESVNVTDVLLAPDAPEKIKCPVLLFAADQDDSVMPLPQKSFIERVGKGQFVFVEGSRHEIYRSKNDVLFPWWHMTLEFLSDPEAFVSFDKKGDA